MNEQETKAVLASFGLPVVGDVTCLSEAEVRQGFGRAGSGAMKILSADILHKTDIGGVMLNLRSEDEAVSAYQQILENARKNAPEAKIDGDALAHDGDGVGRLWCTNRSYLWGDGDGRDWRYSCRATKGCDLYARPSARLRRVRCWSS